MTSYNVLTDDRIKNYTTAFIESFKILKALAKKDNVELSIDKILFKDILNTYDKMAYCLKKYTMQMNHNDKIDSHKISALLLIAIVKHKNIIINETVPSKSDSLNKLPYIYFGFIVALYVMESMKNKDLPEKVVYNINMNYAKEFTKMIWANESSIMKPANSTDCNESYKRIFCLSHLFYFVEKVADKQADE